MIETSSKLKDKLNDKELMELGTILARVEGGKIPNPEALDGFFAALVCCPDLIMPGEYLPVIQSGETEAGDLNFESLEEAKRFMGLVMRHWNHVNGALNDGDIYLPLVLENDQGSYNGNDWAKGFMVGTYLRHSIWAELINDENNGGSIIPIMTLAYENDPDPAMRPFDEPISDSKRDEILIAAAAGVMRMHAYFLSQRTDYLPTTGTFVRQGKKVGRNELCPCGSGAKYKKCCWSGPTIH